MRTRAQLRRRFAAWVAACVVVAVAWIGSMRFRLTVGLTFGDRVKGLTLNSGALGWFSERADHYFETEFITDESFNFQYIRWWPEAGVISRRCHVAYLPLWIPLSLMLWRTVVLWRRPLTIPTQQCACGYDLAGLKAGGVCPECGRGALAAGGKVEKGT